ncbi:serine hydrolase, partial [Candidatus Poribacteria bacterium]|nr:serine hydrolase [Candidatus Poribacteria bacterium]
MPTPAEIVDAIFTDIVKDDLPGAAVLVSRDGEVQFEKGYGLADVGNRVAVTPDTKFRIGSVSKQFTASAILKLQEQGKLSVTDKLSTFIPDYPRGDEVTLHHLLTHTSGVHNYTGNSGFLDLATVPVEPQDHIDYFKDDPYDFDPGEQWIYSNSGYYLLAYVVQLVADQPFGDFLREQFFEPLGMKDTGLHDAETVLTNEAFGYSYENGSVKKALNWAMSRAMGAGSVYSTVRDLQRWNEAVFSFEALTAETMQAALTPARLNDGSVAGAMGDEYGYGWMTSDLRGMKVINHSGGLHGFVAFLAWIPEKQLTVTVLHNAFAPIPRMNPASLVYDTAQVFLWKELPARPSLAAADVDPGKFDAFAGHYVLAGMVKFEVKREGDTWYAVAGPTPQELTPVSDTEMAVKGTSVVLRFMLDEDGAPSHIEREEGGSITEAYPAEEEEEATVPAELLDDYVGEYEYRPEVILTVTREGDQLHAQMVGQPKFPIFARSDTEFFWKVVVASVEFVRDDSAAVAKVVHRQGPAVIHAPKVK